jgi:acetyl-CoA acyltransferase 1
MEKAINRQRVLLAHLEPAASPAAAAPAITASACAAGDSAAYHRGACFADDVVIVA